MSPDPEREPSYEQAVSAWAAHLRAGGTTPWSAWTPDADELRAAAMLHPLPDAIHLELVRRINLAARSTTPRAQRAQAESVALRAGLVDRVLATAAPGRGLIDVPLPWPATTRRFGTPAYDPSVLPEEELVRLAVGVLAHLLPDVPRPPAEVHRPPWPLPWRRRFRLHGAPSTVEAVRRILLAQGYVETDWRPTHVVIARPVEVMMAEHWGHAVRDGGILKWSAVWRRAVAADRLPESIDVARIAGRLHGRRHETVHLVVAREVDEAVTLATTLLRARPAEVAATGDAAVSDLLRRLNRLTALTHGPGQVRQLSRTLVAVLDEPSPDPDAASAPVTPAVALPWARRVAAAAADEIRAAGYAVHGDPDVLAPSEPGLPGTIDRERTLELAVTACLRIWHLGGTP